MNKFINEQMKEGLKYKRTEHTLAFGCFFVMTWYHRPEEMPPPSPKRR